MNINILGLNGNNSIAEEFIMTLKHPYELTYWISQFESFEPSEDHNRMYMSISADFAVKYDIILTYVTEPDEIDVLFRLYLEERCDSENICGLF